MPDPVPPADQFWLMTGDVPSGPFTVDQVHAKIARGDATWETRACPVGGGTWLPLLRTPGIGPGVGPVAAGPDRGPGTSGAKPPDPTGAAVKPDGRFWVLVGTKMIGPLRVGEIRARHKTGELPADAKTRRVGTEEWVPLTEAVGGLSPRPPAVPKAPKPVGAATAVTSPAPPGAASPNPPKGNEELVGAAIGIGILVLVLAGVGYGVYWAYEQLRPYTATEVCKKLEATTTAAEAKKYATPRVHALIDATFADKSAFDPNDTFEWTQEADGPQPATKLVGFRGTWFDQEAGQRVRVEGHFRVVRTDGWKVDDMVFTGVEGSSLPGPVSLVDAHQASLAGPRPAAPGAAPPDRSYRQHLPGQPGRLPQPVTRVKTKWEDMFDRLRDAVGWGGIVGIVVLLVIGGVVRGSLRTKPPSAS